MVWNRLVWSTIRSPICVCSLRLLDKCDDDQRKLSIRSCRWVSHRFKVVYQHVSYASDIAEVITATVGIICVDNCSYLIYRKMIRAHMLAEMEAALRELATSNHYKADRYRWVSSDIMKSLRPTRRTSWRCSKPRRVTCLFTKNENRPFGT
jgi:hypothetical protein